MKLTAYGVFVASVFDLQYLATKCDSKAWSLQQLSVEQLKVKLTENYRLEQARWKGKHLTASDVNYAAKCVRVPIELFKIFEERLKDPSSDNDVHKFIDEHCKDHLNKYYRKENLAKNQTAANVDGVQNEKLLPKPIICMIATAETCKTALLQIREYVICIEKFLNLEA